MSGTNEKPVPPTPIENPLTIRELGEVLIRHYGLHEGRFDVLVEFQIGMGAVGPNPDSLTPGAMIGLARVGLMPSTANGPSSIDAAVVNPAKKPRAKKSD